MNNEIMELLAKSSDQVEIIKKEQQKEAERKRKADIKLQQDIEIFAKKATENSNHILKAIFKEMIKKYKNEPKAVGRNELKRAGCKITYDLTYRTEKAWFYGYRGQEQLAYLYNKKIGLKNDTIGFIDYYPFANQAERKKYEILCNETDVLIKDYKKFPLYRQKEEGDVVYIPIKFDSESVKNEKIFTDFNKDNDDYHNEKYHFGVDIDTIYNLSVSAKNNTLKCDGKLIDKETIRLLKEAYTAISKKEKECQDILDKANLNTRIIYNNIYEKLLKMYLKEPDSKIYIITLNSFYLRENSKEFKKCKYFGKTAMTNCSDYESPIAYLEYMNSLNVKENKAINLKLLSEKLQDDTKYGFINMRYCVDQYGMPCDLEIRFDRKLFEDKILALGKENKTKIRKKQNEISTKQTEEQND